MRWITFCSCFYLPYAYLIQGPPIPPTPPTIEPPPEGESEFKSPKVIVGPPPFVEKDSDDDDNTDF